MDKYAVARELAAVIADEIEAQLGIHRPVDDLPPLIADAILDTFCVTRLDEVDRLSADPGGERPGPAGQSHQKVQADSPIRPSA